MLHSIKQCAQLDHTATQIIYKKGITIKGGHLGSCGKVCRCSFDAGELVWTLEAGQGGWSLRTGYLREQDQLIDQSRHREIDWKSLSGVGVLMTRLFIEQGSFKETHSQKRTLKKVEFSNLSPEVTWSFYIMRHFREEDSSWLRSSGSKNQRAEPITWFTKD